MKGLVYIAGPYAAPTPKERTENVRRIGELSRFALTLGYVPVSVHAAVEAGHYGDDSDPAARARGIDAACGIATMVAKAGGHFFAIRRDDGSYSTGTQMERDVFLANATLGVWFRRATWAEWERCIAAGALVVS
jgi:hypothetical protein